MRIAVHAKVLSEEHLHGIGYYVLNLLEELLKIDSYNEYVLISDSPLRHLPSGLHGRTLMTRPNFLMSYIGFPHAFRRGNFDLAFVPKEVVPPFLGKPVVVTVHDLFFTRKYSRINEQGLSISLMENTLATSFHLKKADRILSVSEATKRDILEMTSISPDRIHVTPLGIDPEFFRPISDASTFVRNKFKIEKPYFLNVSSVWWARKNLLRLINAYGDLLSRSRADVDLVITGSRGSLYESMIPLLFKRSLDKRVHLLEYVPREDLPALYSGAQGFVFPSLHEGFGIPVLEAMACGTPVIASNVSSLPEVVGPAGLLVDPYRDEAISEAMEQLLYDTVLRNALSRNGLTRAMEFTWQKTARETLDIFNNIF